MKNNIYLQELLSQKKSGDLSDKIRTLFLLSGNINSSKTLSMKIFIVYKKRIVPVMKACSVLKSITPFSASFCNYFHWCGIICLNIF
jgi:hypothetical protein